MPTITALRPVAATRYVAPLPGGGGQARKALVAEVVAGELGRRIDLLVPELVALHIDPALGAAEPDPEIQELITASGGLNLGVDFLPSALPFAPGAGWSPDPETAAAVVWLDALTTNVDRTPRNPNLLVWHGRLHPIDHGAALYLHHAGLDPAAHATKPFPQIREHVLLGCAGSILGAHERLSPRVDAALVGEVVVLVPTDWLADQDRGVYLEFLARRLDDGGFATEAEDARAAV